MATEVGSIFVRASLHDGDFHNGLNRMQSGLKTGVAGLARLGAVAAGATAAGLGVAINKAADFDRGMRNVNSIAKLSEASLKGIAKETLALAGPTGQAPKTLVSGLYDIVSSGFKAKDAIKILGVSAKAATAGMTDTATSTKAVVAALNAYHKGAGDARKVSDILFTTVNKGVLTFQELAQNMGDLVPAAAPLGISLEEVGAAMSTITLQGVPAAEAATRVKNTMLQLAKPSDELQGLLKKVGFESGEAAIKSKGFSGVLQLLQNATKGSVTETAKLTPEIRSLMGLVGLTGKNLATYNEHLQAHQDASKGAGAASAAFAEQSKSVSVQWDKVKASLNVLAIEIGNKFLPVLASALTWVQSNWPQISRVFDTVGNAIKTAVGTAVDFIKTHWQTIGSVFSTVGQIVGSVGQTFGSVVSGMASVVKQHFGTIKAVVQGVIDFFRSDVGQAVAGAAVGFIAFYKAALLIEGAIIAAKAAMLAFSAAASGLLANPLILAFSAIGAIIGAIMIPGLLAGKQAVTDFAGAVSHARGVLDSLQGSIDRLKGANLSHAEAQARVVASEHAVTAARENAIATVKKYGAGSLEAKQASDLYVSSVHARQRAELTLTETTAELGKQQTARAKELSGPVADAFKKIQTEGVKLRDALANLQGPFKTINEARLAPKLAEYSESMRGFGDESLKTSAKLQALDPAAAKASSQAATLAFTAADLAVKLGRVPTNKEIIAAARISGLSEFTKGLADMPTLADAAGKNTAGALERGLSPMAAKASAHAQRAGRAVASAIEGESSAAAFAGGKLGTAAADAVGKQTSAARLAGGKLGKAAADGTGAEVSGATFSGGKLGAAVVDSVGKQEQSARTAGKKLGRAAGEGVGTETKGAQAGGSKLGKSVADEVGKHTGPARSSGQKLGDAATDGVGKGTAQMQAKARAEAAKIAIAVASFAGAASAAGFAVGSAAGAGVASGINAQYGAVQAAASRIVAAATSAMRAAARVGSPSKETEEKVGIPLAQGLVEGFKKYLAASGTEIAEATKKAIKMATAVGPAFQAAARALGLGQAKAIVAGFLQGSPELGAQISQALRDATAIAKLAAEAAKTIGRRQAQAIVEGFKEKEPGIVEQHRIAFRQAEAIKGVIEENAKVLGRGHAQAIARGITEGSPGIVAQVRQAMAAAKKEMRESASAAVKDARDAFATGFNNLASAALAAFDKVASGFKSETRGLLEGMQLEDQVKQLADGVENAQKALSKATGAGDVEAIKAAQDSLYQALRAQQIFNLEQLAKAEEEQHAKDTEKKRGRFQKDLELLKTELSKHPAEHKRIQAEINALLNEHIPGYAQSGANLGAEMAKGIRTSIGEVVKAVRELARAIARRLKLKSPAEEGELSDIDTWWSGLAATLASGVDLGPLRGLGGSIASSLRGGIDESLAAGNPLDKFSSSLNTSFATLKTTFSGLEEAVRPATATLAVFAEPMQTLAGASETAATSVSTATSKIAKLPPMLTQVGTTATLLEPILIKSLKDPINAIAGEADQARDQINGMRAALEDLDGTTAHTYLTNHITNIVDGNEVSSSSGSGANPPPAGGGSPRPGGGRPFATGGIVTRPTLAMIGERGPEAVIPLSKGGGYGVNGGGGGTTNVTLNIAGHVLTERQLIDLVTEGLHRKGRQGPLSLPA